MSTKTRNTTIFLAAGVALVGLFVGLSKHADTRAETTGVADAIPSDAQVMVLVNLSSIRSSPYQSLFAVGTVPSMMPGAEAGCGKNLTDRVETLALWTPADPGASFGVAALAPTSVDAVWSCASTTIAARGGKPVFTEVEGFRIITDEALDPGSAQIAVRDPGLLVLGRPATRSRMLDALAGRTTAASQTGHHARMQKALGEPGDLTLTVVVSEPLRVRIARWLGEPLPLLNDVVSLGATTTLETVTHLRAMVWCKSESACAALAARLEAKRRQALDSLAMRAIGVASLLEQTDIEAQGAVVHIRAKAPAPQVLALAKRLEALEQALDRDSVPPVPRPAYSAPDEILRPDPPP